MATIYDNLISKNIDDFATWLDEHDTFDGSPWLTWFDTTYCKKCDPVECKVEGYHCNQKFGYCELNDKCYFFQDLDKSPDNVQIIKMWLQLEEGSDLDADLESAL